MNRTRLFCVILMANHHRTSITWNKFWTSVQLIPRQTVTRTLRIEPQLKTSGKKSCGYANTHLLGGAPVFIAVNWPQASTKNSFGCNLCSLQMLAWMTCGFKSFRYLFYCVNQIRISSLWCVSNGFQSNGFVLQKSHGQFLNIISLCRFYKTEASRGWSAVP